MIKSFLGVSLIDFPGVVSSIVFIGGCNFRCPFCHNPELVLPERLASIPSLSPEEVLKKIERRKNFIKGVEFTGGEPLLFPGLMEMVKEVKKMGLMVKIDTNGSLPDKLSSFLGVADYVAMDLKSSFERYSEAAGVDVDLERIKESIELIKKFPDYEFRTTVVPGLAGKEEIVEVVEYIKGAKRYVLQGFRGIKTLDEKYEKIPPPSRAYMEEVKKAIEGKVGEVLIRNV
ncbi:anaerobic ribonucleoside-triphosphate reductase activating protein [bacterium]|nr:MAG: anaerobic ribonucleoside-triphosphate reductase activating protein [bacterium]